MIHAVSAANQHLYARELDQMFRNREASGFVGNRHAADDLDDDQAVYLMHLSSDGDVVEAVRLNPSVKGWTASLWPEHPSDALIVGVAKFCELQGIAPLLPQREKPNALSRT